MKKRAKPPATAPVADGAVGPSTGDEVDQELAFVKLPRSNAARDLLFIDDLVVLESQLREPIDEEVSALPAGLTLRMLVAGYRSDLPREVRTLVTFVQCIKAGVVPPSTVLQALAAAFDRFIDSHGREPLEHLLGFRSSERGSVPAFQQALLIDRDNQLFGWMAWLCSLDASIATAAGMVADRVSAQTDWNLSGWPKLDARLAAKTLQDSYGTWPGRHPVEDLHRDLRKGVDYTDADREFVRSFPAWSHPEFLINLRKPAV